MDSLDSIVRYPTTNDGWLLTTAIGGVLLFLGFLLVPLFLVYGYLIRVIRTTQSGATEAPSFDDWGTLLVDGVKAWLIGIVYLLVPALIAAFTIGGTVVSLAANGNPGATSGGFVVGLVLSGVLALVFGYIAVAAIVNFAREDEFRAAFDVGVLRRIVLQREYAVAWLVSVAILLVAGLVGSLPFVGWILAPFASFYALTVAGRLWSSGVTAALETTETTQGTSGEQPTA